MILSRGCSYTNETSDLAITVKNNKDPKNARIEIVVLMINP